MYYIFTHSLLFFFIIFLSLKMYAQDWANLHKYQKANKELLKKTKKNKRNKRIVFMGNSITEGWLQDSNSFFYTTSHFINRGIGGQTTPQMLLRFRQDVIDLHPYAVVILAGINDIAGNTGHMTIQQIMDNIISMAELAHYHKIQVILCSVLPTNDFPWRKGLEPAQKVIELNKKIQNYARDKGFYYVDYFSAMVDERQGLRKDLTYDDVHPNSKGYKIMQSIINKTLEQIY